MKPAPRQRKQDIVTGVQDGSAEFAAGLRQPIVLSVLVNGTPRPLPARRFATRRELRHF